MAIFRISNTNKINIGILENYDSFIWTERYCEFGDFELYTKYTREISDLLAEDYYISRVNSETVMIIESREIIPDSENGDKILIKGRSLESLLDRRIVLRQILIDSSLQSGIQTILNKEIIAGTYPERNFPNFIFTASADPIVTALNLKTQYYMDNVYEVISTLCKQNGIGFKIGLNASDQFEFKLYAGVDRSYNQITNPFVVFSPNFDNLINSRYFKSKQNKKNYVFISGEAGLVEWNESIYGRWAQVWTPDIPQGLNRREMFLDGEYLPKTDNSGTPISNADYVAQLEQRGYEALAENSEIELFDADIDIKSSYIYKTHFYLGDILQIVDVYGNAKRVRLTGTTYSENPSGTNLYPILETL